MMRAIAYIREIYPTRYFTGIVLTFAVFPYITVAALNIPSQVQPWCALFAWFTLLLLMPGRNVVMYRFYVLAFLFALFFMLYVHNMSIVSLDYYLRKSSSFLLSISIIIVSQFFIPRQVIGVIKYASIVWLLFAIFGLIYPDLYLDFVRMIVPTALGAYGERGLTSLAPEATDFGFTMACLFVLYLLSDKSLTSTDTKAPLWVYIVLVINILLSSSASGLFALIIIGVSYVYDELRKFEVIKKISIYILLIISLSALYILVMLIEDSDYRGLNMLILAITSPADLVDTTVSYRLAHNMVGFYGFIDSNLLGYGAGSFISMGADIYDKYGIDNILGVDGWYAANIPTTLENSPQAFFPVMIFEYGLIGLIYIFYIFSRPIKRNINLRWVVFAIMVLTWIQSFPGAYPLFWVFVGLTFNLHYITLPKPIHRYVILSS